jgi:hypothetical protein
VDEVGAPKLLLGKSLKLWQEEPEVRSAETLKKLLDV